MAEQVYSWQDRDEDVTGSLNSWGADGHPWVVGTLNLISTPNANFPEDHGSLGIYIDVIQARKLAAALLKLADEHKNGSVRHRGRD